MLRSLYPIQVTQNKGKILITRLLHKSFMNHLNILYGVDSDKQIPLFGLVEPYFLQKLYNFSFDELKFKNEIKEIRRINKLHFWMKTGTMKFSTIH